MRAVLRPLKRMGFAPLYDAAAAAFAAENCTLDYALYDAIKESIAVA